MTLAIEETDRRERNVLVLTPEAYGGHGGIALYNRDMIQSLASAPVVGKVVVLPRLHGATEYTLPSRVVFDRSATGGKLRYVRALGNALRHDRYSAIVCAHINLLPLAYLASRLTRAPLVLCIYGIDAWRKTPSRISNRLARRVEHCVSISDITLDRFAEWSGVSRLNSRVIANAIHLDAYGAGEKPRALLDRYALGGKKVIMTLGRLADEERYKGFDEVIALLPRLLAREPKLAYLIVGDGPDRARLEAKVDSMGLSRHVVFAGRIPEGEKADHYRLGDAYVMPSKGEGFGFVFLEAMACGIPVVASSRDGGREAVLHGKLGRLTDPDDPDALEAAIFGAINSPRHIPDALSNFAYPVFEAKWHSLMTVLHAL